VRGLLGADKGFTLLEVLVVSVVVLLVLTGIGSFYLFGQKSFLKGSDRAALHSNLRLTSERITNEIRLAADVEVLGDWREIPPDPEAVEPGVRYLYYHQEKGSIIILSNRGQLAVAEGIITNVLFTLEGNSLYYRLEAVGKSGSYALESTIFLLNASNPSSVAEPLPALRITQP
jgi:prepilin-type N-terminal cleavage/methylation domain-containing protein